MDAHEFVFAGQEKPEAARGIKKGERARKAGGEVRCGSTGSPSGLVVRLDWDSSSNSQSEK